MPTRALGSIAGKIPSLSTTRPGSIVPLWAGRALLVITWLVVAYGTSAAVPHAINARSAGAWAASLVFLLTFTVVVEVPAALPLLPLSALAAIVMQFCAPSNGAFVAEIAVIAIAGVRLDFGASRRLAGISAVGFLAAGALSPQPLPTAQEVSLVPAFVFTYLGATALRRLRSEQQRTQDLLEEVVAGRDAVIHAAMLDERAHLAREMHDVLAHTLSALSIQLEGAQMLAESRSSDAQVLGALERATMLAREGLIEARRAVGSLKGEMPPGPDMLPQLLTDFERDSGVPCRLNVEGDPVDLPPAARLVLYRIAQEAVTNVRKHADASCLTIVLRYTPDGVDMVIENRGAPRASPLPGGGQGIRGMRERAELLGGTLEAGPTKEGFQVRLWIPRLTRTPSGS